VSGSALAGPRPMAAKAFVEKLRLGGLNVTHRRRKGAGTKSACGQLRLHRGLLGGPA
jgi:adenine C2-methylase RlmN of 23S rRNA A2503 and tRNA A37